MWASCIACSVRPSTFLWWSKYRGMAPILLSHLNGGSIAFNALELRCHLSGSCSLTTTSYYLSLPPWRGWLNMLFHARRDLSELRRIALPRTWVNNARAYLAAPKRPRSVARKMYALDYPSGRTAGMERMGSGRGPKHERQRQRADKGAARRRSHHVPRGPGEHPRLL